MENPVDCFCAEDTVVLENTTSRYHQRCYGMMCLHHLIQPDCSSLLLYIEARSSEIRLQALATAPQAIKMLNAHF